MSSTGSDGVVVQRMYCGSVGEGRHYGGSFLAGAEDTAFGNAARCPHHCEDLAAAVAHGCSCKGGSEGVEHQSLGGGDDLGRQVFVLESGGVAAKEAGQALLFCHGVSFGVQMVEGRPD